jgi:hypothetical protein
MKKIYLSTVFLLAVAFTASAQFTANNLAVLKISNAGGGTAGTGAGAARRVTIQEYTTAGATIGTPIVLPSSGAGVKFVVDERPLAFEGALKLSSDKLYLTAAGFNADAGTTVGGTPNLRIQERRVLRITGAGAIDLTTIIPNADMNGQGTRASVSPGGVSSQTYYSNSGGTAALSIRKSSFGSTSSSAFTPSTGVGSVAFRSLNLHGNFIFGTQGSTKTILYFDITQADGTVASTLPLSANPPSPNFVDVVFFDMDPTANWNSTGYDLMYVSDANNGVGLRKYHFDGTNWITTGTNVDERNFDPSVPAVSPFPAANTGVYSLTGRLEGGIPTLYGIKYNTSTGNVTNNSYLVKVTDAGVYNGAFTGTTTVLLSTDNTDQLRGLAFTPGSTIITLPIKLTSFKGEAQGRNNRLTWATSSEVNFKEFVVERSADGKSFVAVGSPVSTKGVSTGSNYSFIDFNGAAGTLYYRLKSVDNDGTFEYSDVIAIKSSFAQTESVVIYPNPTTGPLTVQHAAGLEKATISVIDLGGKEIKLLNIEKNSISTSLDLTDLHSGVYFIQVLNGEKSVIKLIKN